jgi:hypothetical protein
MGRGVEKEVQPLPLPKVVPIRSSAGWSGEAVERLWKVPARPLLRLGGAAA